MTHEEFHGMLMAALHGPHAREIAEQVAAALDVKDMIEAHEAMHTGERRALWSLVNLAIADHLPDATREEGMIRTIARRSALKPTWSAPCASTPRHSCPRTILRRGRWPRRSGSTWANSRAACACVRPGPTAAPDGHQCLISAF